MKRYTTPVMEFYDIKPTNIITTSSGETMKIIEDEFFSEEEFIG